MLPVVHLLDYGAGNVRSIRNAIRAAGFAVVDVACAADIANAAALVFPGVGSFGSAMHALHERGFAEPLAAYVRAGRPFMGICLGLQTLFEGSEESPGVPGLGVIPGVVARFPDGAVSVPHIGWNGVAVHTDAAPLCALPPGARVYYVHSYRALPSAANAGWVAATASYGPDGDFVAAVQRGSTFAVQFHPEKSGAVGIAIFRAFLGAALGAGPSSALAAAAAAPRRSIVPLRLAGAMSQGGGGGGSEPPVTPLARRIVACLDVRENDDGDLVVTKGDGYDVRERVPGDNGVGGGAVRNLGKPVELCARYYAEGADEIVLLNITAFRGEPLGDAPLLRVLEAASERVFVPLTIGGGIRGYTDSRGAAWTALDVAAQYFRAGADKVSLGSDAVAAAEAWYARGRAGDGGSSIEAIAAVYGRQAVVVSLDPRRVWLRSETEVSAARAAGHDVLTVPLPDAGAGEVGQCWYQCTVRGGREGRPIDARAVAVAVVALGAGELLVNSMDADGRKGGFDAALLNSVCAAVRVPVIASSGAGAAADFATVFTRTRVEAALAAGIFHRREVSIADAKAAVEAAGLPVRRVEAGL